MKKPFRRVLALILILASLASIAAALASCDGSRENEETTEGPEESLAPESSKESDSESGTEAATEPEDIVLFEGGKTEYTLVRPENATDEVIAASKTVYDAINARLDGGTVAYQTDLVYAAAPITEHEILVGKTEREESLTVYAELEAVDGNCYVIRVIGSKVVIAGTNTNMLAKGAEYFIANYLGEKGERVTLDAESEYTSEIIAAQPYVVIDSIEGDTVAKATLLGTLEKDGDFRVAQGSCTDGKYIYIVLENQNTGGAGYKKESHYCKIVKLDAKTLKTVKTSEPLLLDHGNCCTYNADTNEIAVVHNAPNKSYLSFVDADTLELKRTDKNSFIIMYSVAYNTRYKKYVMGIAETYNYAVYSSYPKKPKKYTGYNTGYTKQGMDCDDKYVYFVLYNKNVIVVQDWEGGYIKTIDITGVYDEPEDIFFIGEQMYMTSFRGRAGGANIYRLDFEPKA